MSCPEGHFILLQHIEPVPHASGSVPVGQGAVGAEVGFIDGPTVGADDGLGVGTDVGLGVGTDDGPTVGPDDGPGDGADVVVGAFSQPFLAAFLTSPVGH